MEDRSSKKKLERKLWNLVALLEAVVVLVKKSRDRLKQPISSHPIPSHPTSPIFVGDHSPPNPCRFSAPCYPASVPARGELASACWKLAVGWVAALLIAVSQCHFSGLLRPQLRTTRLPTHLVAWNCARSLHGSLASEFFFCFAVYQIYELLSCVALLARQFASTLDGHPHRRGNLPRIRADATHSRAGADHLPGTIARDYQGSVSITT